ncbi:MAG: hypothetical protein AAGG72_02880, partial [Pseudomonadota bacterium]
PACSRSPHHEEWAKVADTESHGESPDFIYRRMTPPKPKTSTPEVAGKDVATPKAPTKSDFITA